jgi:adenosylcobinamide-GDP ribazoletransferase
LILRLPYARSGEDAKSAAVAGSLTAAAWASSGALGVLGLLPALALGPRLPGSLRGPLPGPLPGPQTVALTAGLAVDLAAALVLALAGSMLAARYFRNRIGGYTGDCLGAVQQISELIFLLAAVALLPVIERAQLMPMPR